MSRNRDKAGHMPDPDDDQNDRPYDVGYRKPPREYRYSKGISGNYDGRPRKAKPSVPRISEATDAWITEANRKIKVREGNREVEMTAQQAVLRASFAASVRGSTAAQEIYLRYSGRASDRDAKLREERFQRIYSCKLWLIEQRETLKGYGRKPSKGSINPDWIRFDTNFNPHVIEPLSASDQRFWQKLMQRLDDEIEELAWLRAEARRDPDNVEYWADAIRQVSKDIKVLKSCIPEDADFELLDI